MTMLLHVRAKARRAAFELDLAHEAALYQRVEAVINRGHGNVGHGLFGPDENLLRRWMVALLQQHVIDLLPLRRETETARAQPLGQMALNFAMAGCLHCCYECRREDGVS